MTPPLTPGVKAGQSAPWYSVPLPFILLLAVAAVLFLGCVAAWWLYRGSAKRPAERYAWSIVAGGVASNLLDRVRLGAVIDPLSIPILRISCNIADAAVVSGIVVLSVLAFRRSR